MVSENGTKSWMNSFKRAFYQPCSSVSPLWKYGFLGVIVYLVAWEIKLLVQRPESCPGDPYSGIVVTLMLLLNHLAYFFSWRRAVTIALRVLAWVWIVFGLVYMSWLSGVLFPQSPAF